MANLLQGRWTKKSPQYMADPQYVAGFRCGDGFFNGDGSLRGRSTSSENSRAETEVAVKEMIGYLVMGGSRGPRVFQSPPLRERRVSSSRVTSREIMTTG
jgi:hypothetical protein